MIKTVWGVTFFVSNLEKATEFYENTLGLEKKYEYSSYVGFECGSVEIGLVQKLSEGQRVDPASPSVEFLVDNVERIYKELKDKGARFIKELHEEPWGGKQATLTDPDGNILNITQTNWEMYFAFSAEGAKRKP